MVVDVFELQLLTTTFNSIQPPPLFFHIHLNE